MHRRPIVIANWKMHTTLAEAEILSRRIREQAERVDDLEIVILPPVIWLPTLAESLHHRPRTLHFGVQNFYPQAEGDFTGEIGTAMLTHLARYALVGHSERRALFGESDEFVNEKVHAAFRAGLSPILCVGELERVMLKKRGRGRPTRLAKQSDVLRQLTSALQGVSQAHAERLIVCYEPLWAVGTGTNVPPDEAEAVIATIRSVLLKLLGAPVAARIRTIYGGSVTAQTVSDYLEQPTIDGVLVGKASLEAKTFVPIIEAASQRAHHWLQHPDH